jgi:hypothetical protein
MVQIMHNNKDTQALSLFSIGKTPLEVIIELDLTTTVVHEIPEEYWALNQLHELAFVWLPCTLERSFAQHPCYADER